jgi:hypothetical protein
MGNVVRLVNGGAIQVRTGVIQGIGPQGPRGVAGPQGLQGEQGPIGPIGPLGQILQSQGLVNMSTSNTLTANSDVTLAWGSVAYDDLSCFTSSTNVTLVAAGDYLLSAWIRFDATPASDQSLWFITGSTTIARKSARSGAGDTCYLDLSFPYRATGNNVITVHARSTSATAVSQGVWAVTRTGSGPQGPQGIQGQTGATGSQGAQGPAGPTGSASGGFTTYADLLP